MKFLPYSQHQPQAAAKLTAADIHAIQQRRRAHNCLGFAYQLAFVRLANRFPAQQPFELDEKILSFVSVQLGIPAQLIQTYAQRQSTLSEHQEEIRTYLALRRFGEVEVQMLEQFLHEGYAHNFPEDYVAPVGVGLWTSTPPQYATALQPYWGENRPFVLADGNACPSVPPPAYSEDADSSFYAGAWEVYEVVQSADPNAVEIARYWADDPGRTATPPGHWVAILNQVLAAEDATLALASESYAKVGIAVADSFITCWHTKFLYSVPRPITYIQQVIDPSWNVPVVNDPVITPPFPEYTSGHSVQSGAAAVVLTALFGEDYAFTDATHVAIGLVPRSFESFDDAANEAAISRLYGGIHYRVAIENGLVQGECVGERVLGLDFGGR